MELDNYVRAVRANWPLVAVAAVLGAVFGVILSLMSAPVYAGTVTFFATTPSNATGTALQGDQFGQQRVNTYVKLLSSQRLADKVVAATGIDEPPRQLMRTISGKADLNTVLFTATATAPTPDEALAVVTAVANEFPVVVSEIESENGTKDAPVSLQVVSGPAASEEPVSPNRKLNMGAFLALGLAVGVGLAVLRSALDRTVRTAERLREITDAPVLGTIPFDENAGASPLILDAQSRSIRAEAYRQLRTNLQFVDAESPVAVLVVTSATPSDGKSTTSANLALTFSDAGKRVLLIDADLRRPRVAEYFGLENAVGLTNVLAGQVRIEDVLQPWGHTLLTVLASGSIPPNPSELLGSTHMQDLLERVRASFDVVIIDTPPLMPVTDAAIVATRADGALVVVGYGKTKFAETERAIEALRTVDARVLGTVLNRSPLKGVDAYSYGHYGYGTEAEVPPPAQERRRIASVFSEREVARALRSV